MDKIKIMGFDPASTKNLGWSIIEYNSDELLSCRAGTIQLTSAHEQWKVLGSVLLLIEEILRTEQPDLVIVEKTSSFSGSFITGQVSYCIGVILAVCSKLECDVKFVFPTHVKKVITDNGKATKSQMKKSVIAMLKSKLKQDSFQFDSPHAIDATANILTWLSDEKSLPGDQNNG